MRKRGARRLVEALHLFGDLLALEHAERLDQLEGDAARDAGDVLGGGEREQRAEQLLDMGLEPEVEPRLHRLARRAGELLVGDDAQRADAARRRRRSSLPTGAPIQRSVPSEASTNCSLRRLRQPGGARVDLAGERPARRGLQRLGFRAAGRRIGGKREAVETADHVALDHHFAGLSDFSFQCRVLAQPPHQHAGAAIDEALGEALMQRIRELVLDAARDGLPMLRIGEPVRPVGHERPGPHMRDPVRERIDVAVGSVGLRHLAENQSAGILPSRIRNP